MVWLCPHFPTPRISESSGKRISFCVLARVPACVPVPYGVCEGVSVWAFARRDVERMVEGVRRLQA